MKRFSSIAIVMLALIVALPTQAGVSYLGSRGLIRTRSADTIGKGILHFQLSSHYYSYPDSVLLFGVFNFPDAGTSDATADYHMITTRAALTYGLNKYLEIATNLEIRSWIRNPQNEGDHSLDVVTRGGLGDLQLTGKFGIPLPTENLKVGGLALVSFPIGNDDRGFTTGETDLMLMGLVTGDFTDLDAFVPTRLHLNLGYRFNRNEEEGYGIFQPNDPDTSGFGPPWYPLVPAGEDDTFNDVFLFNAAVEFPAPQVTFFVEFDWEQFINVDPVPSGVSANVVTITPGLALKFPNTFELKLAADINLNSGDTPAFVGPPDLAWWVMLAGGGAIIPQDRDNDGIPDKDDACPDEPEDLDGFEDEDGCPDLDNDGDGLSDLEDKCPDLAEDIDGFEDNDGCPDLDNDQDGIPDRDDRCPNEPEDFDGDEDDDGCPDLVKDSDGDGVPDDIDRCPLQAEDVDGFQDDDGCPDLDNDLDGIPDADDQCPNAPETFNGFEDEDGCPDEKPIEQQFILKGVTFESGSAALTPDSYRVLDEVVRSLMAYPEVRVEIQGYTDSVGKATYNQDLSQRRAESVKQYIVNAGIDPSRLDSKGFGEENPIADNASAEGRAQNRRIEFKRLN